MQDDASALILTELQLLRSDFSTLARDTAERVSSLEVQVKSGITGNGQPSRLTAVECAVGSLQESKWWAVGAATGASTVMSACVAVRSLPQTLTAHWTKAMQSFEYSTTGLAMTKGFEGLELTAYRDVAGILTIGYGHTGPDVIPGKTITEDEATALVLANMAEAVACVNRPSRLLSIRHSSML
jgi:hypothetical protein